MFPGLNPKQMAKAMKQMGIQSEEINATEVIIKTPDKTIIVSSPNVTKIKMQGQETFQVMGDVTEQTPEAEPNYTADDIDMIVEQTGEDETVVKAKLEENNGDIAKTILDLKD